MAYTFTREHQRQIDSACDCCNRASIPGEDMTDSEITGALAEAGVDDSILEAAVYAVRNNDFAYLKRQYARLALPAIERAA